MFDRAAFLREALAQSVVIGGVNGIVAEKREFSTGSVGWNGNGKVTLMVDGKPVRCQVSLNVTVIGSKPTA